MTALRPRRGRIPHESGLGSKLVAAVVVIALIVPLVVVVGLALNESRYLRFPPQAVSLETLGEVAQSRMWQDALRQSVIVALLSALLSTALGTAAALAVRRLPWPRLLQTVMLLPLVVPLVVTAFAIYPVFTDLGIAGTTLGLVLAHTIVSVPFAFLTVWAAVNVLDPQLERAAASLAAGPFQTLLRITLPIIAPAIAASLVVTAAVSFDEIVVSLYIASPSTRTVPVVLWSYVRENLGTELAAAALFVVVINLAIVLVAALVGRAAVRRRAGGASAPRTSLAG